MTDIQNWIKGAAEKIEGKLLETTIRNKGKIPYTIIDGVYDDKSSEIHCWTNGFWGGILWRMYKETGKSIYRQEAELLERKLDAVLYEYDRLDHDVGFIWLPTSVANYKLTGNEQSRKRGMLAASVLAGRYNSISEHLRAWNDPQPGGVAIIDCMMNIPLLYWASEQSNDLRFKSIAMKHADSTMKNFIREDGSVRHIVIYDTENGGVLEERGGQGFSIGSSWSRGQTWALYGFIISYLYTQKIQYLDTAKRAAHYFISNVCNDWLPKCDFKSPEKPVIYDSTAGASAACGLIEISKAVPEYEKNIYLNAAITILQTMEKNFCNWEKNQDSILQMGTEAYHKANGIHIPLIYGDYYFIEAIYKLKEIFEDKEKRNEIREV